MPRRTIEKAISIKTIYLIVRDVFLISVIRFHCHCDEPCFNAKCPHLHHDAHARSSNFRYSDRVWGECERECVIKRPEMRILTHFLILRLSDFPASVIWSIGFDCEQRRQTVCSMCPSSHNSASTDRTKEAQTEKNRELEWEVEWKEKKETHMKLFANAHFRISDTTAGQGSARQRIYVNILFWLGGKRVPYDGIHTQINFFAEGFLYFPSPFLGLPFGFFYDT